MNIFLKSENFDTLSDYHVVKGKVIELFKSVNAGVKLALDSRKTLNFDAIIQLDKNGNIINGFYEREANMSINKISTKSCIEVSNSNGKFIYFPAMPVINWIKIAQRDSEVKKVFDQINHDFNSWDTCHKIIEIIEEDQFTAVRKKIIKVKEGI